MNDYPHSAAESAVTMLLVDHGIHSYIIARNDEEFSEYQRALETLVPRWWHDAQIERKRTSSFPGASRITRIVAERSDGKTIDLVRASDITYYKAKSSGKGGRNGR